MSLFRRTPRVPSVETPEHCKGEAGIIIEGSFGNLSKSEARGYFSCPGIDHGNIEKIHRLKSGIGERDITQEQLVQLSKLAGAKIKSLCWNCPLGPTTQAPDDLSQLERRPEEN